MKVTDKMIDAALTRAPHAVPPRRESLRPMIQAALDLLDPVPHDVMEIRDNDGRLWRRTVPGSTTWHRPNASWSVMELQRLFGPLTTRDGEPL